MLWLNGRMLAEQDARIDPSDRGFTLGDGVFETVLALGGRAVHLERHLRRLREGAAVLGIPIDWGDDALDAAIRAVIGAQGLGDAACRVTLSRGPAPRGVSPSGPLTPTLLITAGPRPAPAPPAHMIVARGVRRDQASPLSRIKSLNYLDSILARREAEDFGGDDALLLNTRGRLAEASAANVFLVEAAGLVTPPVAEGALPGVRRGLLIEAGLAVEAVVTEARLRRARAGFLTSSLGLRGIASIDGRRLDLDHPGLRAVQAWAESGMKTGVSGT